MKNLLLMTSLILLSSNGFAGVTKDKCYNDIMNVMKTIAKQETKNSGKKMTVDPNYYESRLAVGYEMLGDDYRGYGLRLYNDFTSLEWTVVIYDLGDYCTIQRIRRVL